MESNKKDSSVNPFADRRNYETQLHEIPSGICRRNKKRFKNKHWWLEVDYTQAGVDRSLGK